MSWRRTFLRRRTGKVSANLRALYDDCSEDERCLSDKFFARYPLGKGVGTLTPFEGIRQDPGPLSGASEIAAGLLH